MPETEGLNREQWEEKLAALGAEFQARHAEATLEIIGAWPVIDAGMPGRTSLDLDIWMPGSRVDRGTLRAACAATGLGFDPLEETDRPYLQLVRPGIVEMPRHTAQEAGTWGGLTILVPPPAALAAAKLVRASDKDLADIFFLCSKHALSRATVAACVEDIPDSAQRQTARENLVYLSIPF